MPSFKKYPSIEQFRNVVRSVRKHCDYENIPYPTLNFSGTVKLHGTNACIIYDAKNHELACQSRNGIITPEKDNAGFAAWVEERKEDLLSNFNLAYDTKWLPTDLIYIYGEFCGGNIQKGVGISGLNKMFVVFEVRDDNQDWLWHPYRSSKEGIYSTSGFPTYSINIDFEHPDKSTHQLQELTLAVEKECPVAKAFGVENGVGEGIVWQSCFEGKNLRFKVKGEKHSSSKVKTLAAVDIEKMKSIDEFVEYAVTENRLNQGLKEINTGDELTQKDTGDFVCWVANDVIKEESDTLEASGLIWKDVGGRVGRKASKWFLENL